MEKTGGLPIYIIRSIKKITEDIILNDTKFSRLNKEEYKDFMEIVHELNDSNINIFSDWYFFKFNKEGSAGIQSLISTFGDSHLVWYRISATAENMDAT